MYLKTKGLVLRETRIKEADKLLTLLVPGKGRVTAKARGVLREKSRSAAACQLFCWSEFTLYENRGLLTVTEAEPAEMFSGLQTKPACFALAAYFSEICELLSDTDSVSDDLLRLVLNMFYALAKLDLNPELVRAAFEARALVFAGYAPMLECCSVCAHTPEDPVISLSGFSVRCFRCGEPEGSERRVSFGAYSALLHFVSSPLKKILSVSVTQEEIRELTSITEGWLESRVGGRSSRNYYKGMISYG